MISDGWVGRSEEIIGYPIFLGNFTLEFRGKLKIKLNNCKETLMDNETSFMENYIEAVTITEEEFENIPPQSNTETVWKV